MGEESVEESVDWSRFKYELTLVQRLRKAAFDAADDRPPRNTDANLFADAADEAEGSASTLYNDDETNPVRVAVDAVRLFLIRRACEHEGALRFCQHCGIDTKNRAAKNY